jgi:hypothetical protein
VLGNILLGLLFLGANRYGDYITDECPQGGYSCPKICDVDHKHLPIKECENAKRKRDIWEASWKASEEKETREKSDS